MALTKAQVEAIQRAQKKAVAQRAATQRTKISDSEARKASSTMNKRAGGSPAYTLKDSNILSKSELNAVGRQTKANAEKEKAMQKQRKFAKGEGKLPTKERVGTKAEYKQLGKEIQTRKQLIAYGKAARAAQAERAKNPAPAKETKPVATKKTTPAKTTAKKATPKKVTVTPKDAEMFKKASVPSMKKALKKAAVAPKAKTPGNLKEVIVKGKKIMVDKKTGLTPKETSKMVLNEQKMTEPTTPKSKPAKKTAKATAPKKTTAPKLQTLEEAKAKAPKPMLGPEAPAKVTPKVEAPAAKPAGKAATAARAAKKAVASNKTVQTVKAASQTSVAKKVVASKPAKLLKGAGKVAKVGLRIGQFVAAGKEVGQVVSGQAEKDFRRIQALENRIAIAKGQKPKYTTTGTNQNMISSMKTDLGNAANILTAGMAGKTRKDRLQELKAMLAKTEKKAGNKPVVKPTTKGGTPVVTTPGGQKVGGNTTPKAVTGDKYVVKKGDTLSAIASRSGVSLKELRAANPKFTTQAKYKGGNTIFSGTSVAIPKKKAK